MNVVDVIPQFQEYMKSAKVGRARASLLLIEHTVPISSAEAERGFSQMNLVGWYRLQVKVIGFQHI